MSRRTKAPWRVKTDVKFYVICSVDVPLALVLPNYIKDRTAAKANANLMAVAPQLLDALKEVHERLENCMIVTSDGFKINDSGLRQSIADAIMRAEGYRT